MADIAWLQAQPRKRSACGVLFVKEGKLLIVKPSYKENWSIPGGVCEEHESPLAACLRECKEEIGIEVTIQRLAAVDWMPSNIKEVVDSLQFIFLGVSLTPEQEAAITLQAEELVEWCYVAWEEAIPMLSPNLQKRVDQALKNLKSQEILYLESGQQAF